MDTPPPAARDLIPASALAGVMTLAWWWMRRADLIRLSLPDGDDAVRLQQIRDWLGGQAFGDLSQYRIGIDGIAMHWSRLPDLVPAALLNAGVGEPAMLVLWPAMLFVALLFATARIARAIGAGAVEAMIFAALAYPATTLFAPGRIDHHGLQMLLLALFALGLVGRSPFVGGVLAGTAAALSLGIGMETAPILATGVVAAGLVWIRLPDARLGSIGGTMLAALAALAALFAPNDWASAPCDGFADPSWRAATIGAAGLVATAIAGSRLGSPRARSLLAVAIAAVATIAIVAAAPACLSPYGAVDPVLANRWLSQVGEAQSALVADPRWTIGYVGVGLAALVAAALAARTWRALTLAGLVAAGLALALVQLRGAYGAAALAPALLSLLLGAARRRSVLAALSVWVAGTGITWPIAAAALPVAAPPSPAANAACDDIDQAMAMRTLPPGRVLGPVDLGPWLLVATPHHAIAAPYHRNAAGNLASYRLLGADDVAARSIVQGLRIDHIVACPAALSAMRIKRGLGWRLVNGETPAWLEPAGVRNVWRVRR